MIDSRLLTCAFIVDWNLCRFESKISSEQLLTVKYTEPFDVNADDK